MTVEHAIADLVRAIVREEVARAISGAAPRAEHLTTEQAAEVAGVTPKTIRAWVSEGLAARRRGRRLVIARADLDAWRTRGPTRGDLLSSLTGGT